MAKTFTPTLANGSETPEAMRDYSKFSKRFVVDRRPVELFNFMNFTEHDPDNLQAMDAGGVELGEVSTSAIGALLIAASTDAYGHQWIIPYWMDPSKQIDFCALWSNSQAAGTGTLGIAIKYTPVDVSAQSVATAIGATVLDSTIDSQADLAANVARWTEWGYISADKAGVKDLDPGRDFLCLTTIATLTTITDASIYQVQARGYVNYL